MQACNSNDAAGLAFLGEQHLCPLRAVEQRRASRIALARALAAQWFGQLVVVSDPADEWLLWGLQGYAVALFMHTAYGGCEVAYHRIRERDVVCAA